MSKNVSFLLGPAVLLTRRHLVITRMHLAGDDTPPAARVDVNLNGAAVVYTCNLADNTIYQAVLTDYRLGGLVSVPDVLNFHTGELQFPGPKSHDRLALLSMEQLSSSSLSSVSSISTSGSSSSSSVSSVSSSSVSSISTSASSVSSISTSSSSRSSISTSGSSSSSSRSSVSTSSSVSSQSSLSASSQSSSSSSSSSYSSVSVSV